MLLFLKLRKERAVPFQRLGGTHLPRDLRDDLVVVHFEADRQVPRGRWGVFPDGIGEDVLADLDVVPVLQGRRSDFEPIDERAVVAAQIREPVSLVVPLEPAVVARHAGILQDDVVVRRPPERVRIGGQHQLVLTSVWRPDLQLGHRQPPGPSAEPGAAIMPKKRPTATSDIGSGKRVRAAGAVQRVADSKKQVRLG